MVHPIGRETADRILNRSSYDVDPPLLELIHPIKPEEVNVYPASGWLMRTWKGNISGATYGSRIYVRPVLFDGDPDRFARLVIHELVHVRQYDEMGFFRFISRYFRDYLRGRFSGMDHREAYRAIPVEVEAREITSTVIA